MPASTLYDCAVATAIRYSTDINSVGSIPFELVAPVLHHIQNAYQLAEIEKNSPQVIGHVDHVWRRIFERDFKGEGEWQPPADSRDWFTLYTELDAAKTAREKAMFAAFAARFPIASQVKSTNKTILVDEKDLPTAHIKQALGKMRSNIRASEISHRRILAAKSGGPSGVSKSTNQIMKKVQKTVQSVQTVRRIGDQMHKYEKLEFASKRQKEMEMAKAARDKFKQEQQVKREAEEAAFRAANPVIAAAAAVAAAKRTEPVTVSVPLKPTAPVLSGGNLALWKDMAAKAKTARKASPPLQQGKPKSKQNATAHKERSPSVDVGNVSDTSTASSLAMSATTSSDESATGTINPLKRKAVDDEIVLSAEDNKAQPRMAIRRPKKTNDPFLRSVKDSYRSYGKH